MRAVGAKFVKKALITGITGQDGSYLAELLLDKGYEVHGIVRKSSRRRSNILAIWDRLCIHYGDMATGEGLEEVVAEVRPDEIYNLASQSEVKRSFDDPVYTLETVAGGTMRLLEIVRRRHPSCRFYQASTSEMFGNAPAPQSETTAFLPESPYAVAKLATHHLVRVYREGHGLYACSGILFNHESPRRGRGFVTRKITRSLADILAGTQDSLSLGTLETVRDWGFAKEYVEAMWLMLQQDEPDDFVIATGVPHSVREFVELAFAHVGLDYRAYVRFDSSFTRPREPAALWGDATKAQRDLNWRARTTFEELVAMMVDHDLRAVKSHPAADCDPARAASSISP